MRVAVVVMGPIGVVWKALLAAALVWGPAAAGQAASAGAPRLIAATRRNATKTAAPIGGLRFPVFYAFMSEEEAAAHRRALLLHRQLATGKEDEKEDKTAEEEQEEDEEEDRHTFSRAVPVYGTHEKMGYFYANAHIGTPAQKFGVILDTGSSIMSVPGDNCSHCGTHLGPGFNASASATAVDTQKPFSQSYAEGSSLHGVCAVVRARVSRPSSLA
jgi:hypothetical protein